MNYVWEFNCMDKIKVVVRRLYFILLFTFAYSTVIHVPGDYTTIQAGIDASVDGDTVLVADGIYYENLVVSK